MIKSINVKNCENKNCNGIYKLINHNFYKKNDEYHLYKHKGIWRLGNKGIVCYKILKECVNSEWNLKELDIKKKKINTIHHFLSKYKNKKIIYIPNPGNAGDSLIAFGTLQVFNKLNLKYQIGNINKKYNNKILFYAGGGNLVGLYKNCKKFITNNIVNNKIVLLPHTIKSEDSLIKSLNNNIIIFCREKVSYKYVHHLIKNKKNVILEKDMAFHIKGIQKYKKIKGNGVCNCFRTDSEKTLIKIPKNNIDLSNKLNKKENTTNINTIKQVSLSIFNYLSKYETINTNRLHMAIAGSLLDKKVYFYSNSYYKNKAVYDYSIKNIYNKTIFIK